MDSAKVILLDLKLEARFSFTYLVKYQKILLLDMLLLLLNRN